jgi:hypothetical protein
LPSSLFGRTSSWLCRRGGSGGVGGFSSFSEGFRGLADTLGDFGEQSSAEDEEVIGLRLGEAIDFGVLELVEVELLGAVAVFG